MKDSLQRGVKHQFVIWMLVLSFVLSGCATTPGLVQVSSPPKGTLFASIMVVNTGISSYDPKKTGMEFYIESEPGIAGPRLTVYVYKESVLTEMVGGGSDSADVVNRLNQYQLVPFDFDGELRAIENNIRTKAKEKVEASTLVGVLDGEELEITIQTAQGPLHLRAWNPGCYVDSYYERSANFLALKQTIDELARFYGRSRLRL